MNSITTTIITISNQKNSALSVDKLMDFFDKNNSVSIVNVNPQEKLSIDGQHNISYFNCENEHQKIEAFNSILTDNADTDNDILLIDESALQSISDESTIFDEMREVLYYTEKHGFASPRIERADNPKYYTQKLKLLPRFSVSPEPDLRCVYIKKMVFNVLGTLDESYNTFYYAFLDFVQRVNALGFSCAKSNHAFVDGDIVACDTAALDAKDEALFFEKYPYYSNMKTKYVSEVEKPIKKYFSYYSNGERKKRILFNCRNIEQRHNGTTEYQLAIFDSFYKLFQDKYDIYIYLSHEADDFHKLSEKYTNILYDDTISGMFDLGFRGLQNSQINDLRIMNNHCLKSVNTLLDVIALRSHYIREEVSDLKKFVELSFQLCDGIVTISDSSNNDFRALFNDNNELQNKPTKIIYIGTTVEPVAAKKYDLPFDEYFLIVGNHFKHKALSETLAVVADSGNSFIMIGGEEKGLIRNNIYNYPSGQLENDFVNCLYSNCKALVFPSVYEGFGIPITVALKMKKQIILYNNQINNELLEHFDDFKDSFHFFDSFSEISNILSSVDFSGTSTSAIYTFSWDNVALEIEAFFDEVLNTDIDFAKRAEHDHLVNLLIDREDLYKTLATLARREYQLQERNQHINAIETHTTQLTDALNVAKDELVYVKSRMNYRIAEAVKRKLRKVLRK